MQLMIYVGYDLLKLACHISEVKLFIQWSKWLYSTDILKSTGVPIYWRVDCV